MSAAEVDRATTPSVRRPSSRFLRSELRLALRRRRNLAGLGVLAAVPVLIAVAVKISAPSGSDGPAFFSSITDNGLFVALSALTIETGLFLPLAVAAVSGDAVAGEANLGTLRYLLAVPVQRSRLLAVKYAAIVVGGFVAVLVVAVTGLLVGLLLFGGGPVTLVSGDQVGLGDGLLRLLGTAAYLGLCLAALGAVGLFVSTLTEQPIGAMIAVVVFSTASFILDTIPQISWLHPFLLTHHWLDYGDLFRDPVAWSNLGQGCFSALVYAVVFWLAAWARFGSLDVTA